MLVFIFAFGLIIGSFLNVCIYRLPRHESIVFGPSHCTKCNERIKWYDLIPVFSYIFLLGKCRKCKEKISIIYPTIELANALAYVGLYLYFGISILTLLSAIVVSTLIVLIMIKILK